MNATENQKSLDEAPREAVLRCTDLLDRGWEQFKAADENNHLRLGDAADALLSICHLIEQLPASPLQTEISLRASELRRRMADQASSGYTFECLCEVCGKQFRLPHRDAPHRCGCDRSNDQAHAQPPVSEQEK